MKWGQNNTALWGKVKAGQQAQWNSEDQALQHDTSAYRMALERAAYGNLGPQFQQGMAGVNGFLSGQGPLSDSGARSALTTRLAGDIYGRANQQVTQGVAGLTGDLIGQRNSFKNQLALLRYQKKLQGSGFGQFAGRVVGGGLGFLVGGPQGAAIGAGVGGSFGKPQ